MRQPHSPGESTAPQKPHTAQYRYYAHCNFTYEYVCMLVPQSPRSARHQKPCRFSLVVSPFHLLVPTRIMSPSNSSSARLSFPLESIGNWARAKLRLSLDMQSHSRGALIRQPWDSGQEAKWAKLGRLCLPSGMQQERINASSPPFLSTLLCQTKTRKAARLTLNFPMYKYSDAFCLPSTPACKAV